MLYHDFETISKIGGFIKPCPKAEMEKINPYLAENFSVDTGPSKQFSSQTVFL